MIDPLTLISIAFISFAMGWSASEKRREHLAQIHSERRWELTAFVRPAIEAEFERVR